MCLFQVCVSAFISIFGGRRHEDVRLKGHTNTVKQLTKEGFAIDLSSIFLYDQQPFIDSKQKELDG